MHRISKHISETVQLADLLVEDIRRRNLQPGDAYFTTRDARQFLGVGGTAANRAMQLLEKRLIIQRTQRRGATVLSPPKPHSTEISRVHILMPELYYRTEGFGGDGILFGVQSEFPAANVSHCLLSGESEVERIESLVHQAMASGGTDAFVLASAPFEIQRAVARTGFPAVVYGTAYRGIGDLSQLERDQRGAVVELVHHLQKQGSRRIATLFRQHIMPGDHQAFDAILSMLGNSAPIRFLASDHEHMVAEVRNILSQEPSVDGFLCRTTNQAEAVVVALEQEGRSRDDVEIGVLLSYARRYDPPKFTHIRLVPTPEEIGRKLALMLRDRNLGFEAKSEVIPVELIVV